MPVSLFLSCPQRVAGGSPSPAMIAPRGDASRPAAPWPIPPADSVGYSMRRWPMMPASRGVSRAVAGRRDLATPGVVDRTGLTADARGPLRLALRESVGWFPVSPIATIPPGPARECHSASRARTASATPRRALLRKRLHAAISTPADPLSAGCGGRGPREFKPVATNTSNPQSPGANAVRTW
jgi:hypothetical protein